jgi:hypothetical protein
MKEVKFIWKVSLLNLKQETKRITS